MRRCFALAIAAVLVGAPRAGADGLDDQYVAIYNTIQDADTLESNHQTRRALARYTEAQAALTRFQKVSPDWNPAIIKFRLNYVSSRIAELSGRMSGSSVPAAPSLPRAAPRPGGTAAAPGPSPAVPNAPPASGGSPPSRELESQVGALQTQVRQLQQDKLLLEAKLKEALAAQPAAVDPRELALAGQRITNLQKENDLLRVALDAAKARSAAGNTRALEQALAETNRKLAEQTALSAQLAREKEALQAGSKGSRSEAEAATLRAENALLKKQLAAVKAAPPATDQAQGAAQQLALARAQLAAMQSDKALLRLEKAALENRVKQLTAGAPAQPPAPVAAGPPRSEDAARVKQLQRERDDLQKKLEAALRELDSRKSKAVAARVREMETELAGLRARLSVYETKKVPYTSEELALFRTPETRLAQNEPAAARKSVAQVPSGMAVLAAEAQRHFQARQYDKAEEAYGQMLRRDQKSVYVLANLAAVQLEANHLPQAEKNIQQALSLAPEDPYSLAILGYLKFRQAKFDAALDALSRAAKLDPNNAEIQNYLGLTLSEKGMRGPAETALRKALDLDPMYASAHNNLAVIYITQQPPLVELARWHYQKALTAGHPRNPELEKMFQGKKAIE